jgi:hypothetical protein
MAEVAAKGLEQGLWHLGMAGLARVQDQYGEVAENATLDEITRYYLEINERRIAANRLLDLTTKTYYRLNCEEILGAHIRVAAKEQD